MDIKPNIEVAFMEDFFLLRTQGYGEPTPTISVYVDAQELLMAVRKAIDDAVQFMPQKIVRRFSPGGSR